MSTLTLMGAGPESGTAFSVLSLSPVAWYDFSGLGLSDGTAISTISDLSGNAHTATQATGAKQPIFKTAIQNGLGIGRFVGTSSQELLTASFATTQPLTVYAVMANLAATTGRYFSSTDGGIRFGSASAVPGHDLFAGAAVGGAYASGTYSAFRQVTVIMNNASTIMRSNGAQDATATAGANAGATGIALGSQGGGQFWSGDLCEIFAVASATLSTAAEAYLKTKWNTP